jgi:hypothetical protein
MQGRATDMYKEGGHVQPYWTEQEFNELRDVAIANGATDWLPYTQYSDRHLHVEW